MYELRLKFRFEAAHRLPGHPRCGKVHGHSYLVEVVLEGEQLKDGMLVDFGEVKEKVRAILPDHEYLNEVLPFIPTAENLARYFFEKIGEILDGPAKVKCVVVWETPNAGAAYSI